MIKAVIFDVDGVLIDSFEANLKFFQDLMTYAGYAPPTREEFPDIFHLSMWDAIKKMSGLSSEGEIRKIWEMGRSREMPYQVELLKMPENAEAVLAELRTKYPLGIVTSRIKESVFESPDLEKLQNYFQVVVSYEDTENHKPHPEPLLLAAEKLGIKQAEAVYIGDTESDIKAAHAAGMKAILYSKDKTGDADAYTASFKQLIDTIEGL